MKIGLIADIHGNLHALEAVLAALAADHVDQIVCLGDTAATGPQPQAVIERLQQLGCPVVMGNADAELVGLEPFPSGDFEKFGEMDHWCAGQLSASALAYIQTFQAMIELPLANERKLVCFHGSPRSYNEIITAATPDQDLEPMLAGVQAFIYAGGHTHFQVFRRYRDAIVLNPGSVGLAYDRTQGSGEVRITSWAEYAVIILDGDYLSIDMRRTSFDGAAFKQTLLNSGMPHAAWWASLWTI
jgi:putative phosphoesterase